MMRWSALQYSQILVAWGDYYFMQSALQTIPLAIQLYIRASHTYGPTAQQIRKRGIMAVQIYNSFFEQVHLL